MTLSGQKNHYNIKFLKGYGLSVKLKDNKVILKNGYNPFSDSQEQEEWFITNLPYEKIVLCGKGYVSTEALTLLNQNNRNLILVDTFGKPVSMINGVMQSMTGTNYRIGQYDTFRNPEKRKYLSKQIVKGKIESQIRFLKSANVGEVFEDIAIDQPLVNEGKLARRYFLEYSKLIPDRFGFNSRNQSQIRTSKNNATDIINALLNYGYTILAGEISKFINGIGLDPYFGFYHKMHSGFQPLVYDMMEPFRWLVDHSVWKLANAHSKEQRIYQKDYAYTKDGSVVMDNSLIRRFLELLERTLQKERRYAFRHGAKTKDGLKSVQEITIAKISVTNLAEYCLGKQNTFQI